MFHLVGGRILTSDKICQHGGTAGRVAAPQLLGLHLNLGYCLGLLVCAWCPVMSYPERVPTLQPVQHVFLKRTLCLLDNNLLLAQLHLGLISWRSHGLCLCVSRVIMTWSQNKYISTLHHLMCVSYKEVSALKTNRFALKHYAVNFNKTEEWKVLMGIKDSTHVAQHILNS